MAEINWATARRISVDDYISEAENAGRVDVVPFVSVVESFSKVHRVKKKEILLIMMTSSSLQ